MGRHCAGIERGKPPEGARDVRGIRRSGGGLRRAGGGMMDFFTAPFSQPEVRHSFAAVLAIA
jgi:hypothetical protein